MIADEPTSGFGHNSRAVADAALREIREAMALYANRRDDIVAACARAEIRERADAADAADLIRVAKQVWSRIDDARRAIGDPHRAAAEAVKAEADSFWRPARDAMDKLDAKVACWLDEERQRIAAQQAEQDAAMARMVPPSHPNASKALPVRTARPPQPAKIETIRGDLGGKVRSVDQFDIEVEDVALVPGFILDSEPVRAAIVSVVQGMARKGTTIPGIRITPRTVARIG